MQYSKKEFYGLICIMSLEILMVVAVIGITTILKINSFGLPVNFIITFLPVDGYGFNWFFNLLFQLFCMGCAAFVYSPYISTVLVLFDHTCWAIDILLTLLNKLDINKEASSSKTDHKLIKKRLKIIYETHLNTLDWIDELQNTIKFNFMIELTIFSILICLCIYSVDQDILSFGYTNQLILALLAQLFISCFMGTRVVTKIEELRATIYSVEWYNYDITNMKTVKIMLQASQNMEGFHGIFRKINMETFQQVNIS